MQVPETHAAAEAPVMDEAEQVCPHLPLRKAKGEDQLKLENTRAVHDSPVRGIRRDVLAVAGEPVEVEKVVAVGWSTDAV